MSAELLRYVRSELRPARLLSICGGVIGGMLLIALFAWNTDRDTASLASPRFWLFFHGTLLAVSGMLLTFWSVISTAQSLVSERTQKSFDFWRITRSTAGERIVGKLFGPALPAWLQFLCALPVLLATAVPAHIAIGVAVASYVAIALFAMATSSIALCVSARASDARRAQFLAFLSLAPLLGSFGNNSAKAMSSVWRAFVPHTAIFALYGGSRMMLPIFEHPVSALLVSAVVYLVVIAWAMAVLPRVMTREPEQVPLLAGWQAIGIGMTIILLGVAAYTAPVEWVGTVDGAVTQTVSGPELLASLVSSGFGLTGVAAYVAAAASLATADQIRRRLRERGIAWSMRGLVAPWLTVVAIGFVAIAAHIASQRGALDGLTVPWAEMLWLWVALAVYVVRDGLLLQALVARRMKVPMIKGFLLLGGYYVAVTMLAFVSGNDLLLRWTTPKIFFEGESNHPLEMLVALIVPGICAWAIARWMTPAPLPLLRPALKEQ